MVTRVSRVHVYLVSGTLTTHWTAYSDSRGWVGLVTSTLALVALSASSPGRTVLTGRPPMLMTTLSLAVWVPVTSQTIPSSPLPLSATDNSIFGASKTFYCLHQP